MKDGDVRQAMLLHLTDLHRVDANTKVVQEMGVWSGSVRIDIAVINGELCGFELKSDRDTLERLPAQADIYSRVFDRVELVVGSRHVEKAKELVPDWWGVIVAEMSGGRVGLVRSRTAVLNPSPDPLLVAQLLWKAEALSVLESLGLADGVRSKKAKDLHQRLASTLSFSDLAFHVRSALKKRPSWLG
jgi:hypothetical protein